MQTRTSFHNKTAKQLFISNTPNFANLIYDVLTSGFGSQTKISFISSNSSFIECMRNYLISSSLFTPSSNNSPTTCRENCSFTDSHLTLTSSDTFASCEWMQCKGNMGGGIYTNQAGSTLTVTSCHFYDCSTNTDYGGGIATEFLNNVYIYSSSFIHCHGGTNYHINSGGGAVFLNDTKQWHQIHDCNFIGCYSGADGGALHLRNCKVPHSDGIANTRFIDCKTVYDIDAVEGGAVQSWTVTVTCSFSNSLIARCHSYQGGGFFFQVKENYATNIILFCLFHINTATGTGNDLAVYNLSQTDSNFFQHCFSTSQSNRVDYYDGIWYHTDHNWLP